MSVCVCVVVLCVLSCVDSFVLLLFGVVLFGFRLVPVPFDCVGVLLCWCVLVCVGVCYCMCCVMCIIVMLICSVYVFLCVIHV